MTTTKLLLPDGSTVRTATARRFVLAARFAERDAFIVKRSDNVETLRKEARRFGIPKGLAAKAILDTATGEVVR